MDGQFYEIASTKKCVLPFMSTIVYNMHSYNETKS